MRLRYSAGLICLLVLATAIIATPTMAKAQSAPLVGSWTATFTDANDPPQFTLPALFTFHADGTLVETDGGELAPGPDPYYTSPGHGVWRKLVEGVYDFKFQVIAVNADGTLNSTGVIRLTLHLSSDGNSFSGSGVYAFFDAEGNPIVAGPEKLVGSRITLQ